MSLAAYGVEIARRWLLVLTCLAVGVGAATLYASLTPREYSSSARLFVGLDPGADQPKDGAVYQAIASTSLDEFVESKEAADRVSSRLDGDVEPDALREAVVAAVIPDTTIIRVTATDRDPVRARDIAGAYAETLSTQEPSEPDGVPLVWRVLDAPEIDGSPASRPWWRNLGVGAALGLLVGVGVAAARVRRSVTP